MSLADMLDMQRRLQIESYGADPTALDDDARMEYIRWNVLALTDELHEMLAETGWKPWAKSQHVNEAAAFAELVDAWHFFMNLMMAVTGESNPTVLASFFEMRYAQKRLKNADRQAAGYDGVSTKCPECKRALDDDAVTCEPYPKDARVGYGFCSGQDGGWYRHQDDTTKGTT